MADDLFRSSSEPATLPLASRMRPRSLDEYVGQQDLLGPGTPTRQAIEEGKLGSVVLWAPPGCGKTTLAHIVAKHLDAHIEVQSAVTAGVADIRRIAKAAADRQGFEQRATLLLLDEIHHFNKSQQDALLGYLEDGTLSLIGATTENPFVVLHPALLSRARVLPLKPLVASDIEGLLTRALADQERGLGARDLSLSDDALAHLVTCAAVRYDRQGDYHYDTISAFIKSVRGSDSDAALHYLARMIQAGEDPRFICRRLMILASEEIGNAEPQALVLAVSAAQAVERLGMPEARIVMGQLVTFLAEAPKSNRSYVAIDKALADVESKPLGEIPMHLRNAPHSGLSELGHGEGYQYPHDAPGGWVDVDYLPEGADLDTPYYDPTDRGYERRMKERRDGRK